MTRGSGIFAAPLIMLLTACTPSSVAPSGSPQTSASAKSSPVASAASQEPTPLATTIGDAQALVISLGRRSGPFDIKQGFGSLWVTGHHTDEVIRIDPATLKIVARIKSGPGPGWLAITEDAVWVTNKNGSGVSRIDPSTNALVTSVGSGSPCGPDAAAFGSVWFLGCDTQVIQRVDPATNKVGDSFPATGYSEPLLAGDELAVANADGLARLDPTTGTITAIGGCCGLPFGYDGTTVWLNGTNDLTRVDPASGKVVAAIHLGSGATSITFVGDDAWVTFMSRHELIEIDLTTNKAIRTIDIGLSPITVYSAFDALWVTDYDAGNLWELTP
jgi:DNA-binding beta-propeller fold protein YncE